MTFVNNLTDTIKFPSVKKSQSVQNDIGSKIQVIEREKNVKEIQLDTYICSVLT